MDKFIRIESQTSDKLSKCYYRYNYMVVSSYKPTVEECKELCGSGNFNNGAISNQEHCMDETWITHYVYVVDSGD